MFSNFIIGKTFRLHQQKSFVSEILRPAQIPPFASGEPAWFVRSAVPTTSHFQPEQIRWAPSLRPIFRECVVLPIIGKSWLRLEGLPPIRVCTYAGLDLGMGEANISEDEQQTCCHAVIRSGGDSWGP